MAGELDDVVPGEPVEAGWGNEVRDRILSRYADATERTAINPIPAAGDQSYLDDLSVTEYFDGNDWVRVLTLEAGDAVFLPVAGGSMDGDQPIGQILVRNVVASETEPPAPDIGLVWLDIS